MRGEIKFWRADRGFGFLATDDGAPDTFCHVTALVDRRYMVGDGPQIGAIVEFEMAADPRSGRPCAANVHVIETPRKVAR